jgi:hypothetical protein
MICGYKNVPREDNKLAGIYFIRSDPVQFGSDPIIATKYLFYCTVRRELYTTPIW